MEQDNGKVTLAILKNDVEHIKGQLDAMQRRMSCDVHSETISGLKRTVYGLCWAVGVSVVFIVTAFLGHIVKR
jgi:hypothetical protein